MHNPMQAPGAARSMGQDVPLIWRPEGATKKATLLTLLKNKDFYSVIHLSREALSDRRTAGAVRSISNQRLVPLWNLHRYHRPGGEAI